MKTQQGFALVFIVIGIIAVLVGALGFVLWNSIGSSESEDTSTWKTFENETLPITFKYPSDWTEVEQANTSSYVKLFGGSTDSVKGYSLGIFYGKDKADTLPLQTDCSKNSNETKSCEQFKTDTMTGLLIASKAEGSDFEFSSNIGADRYTFNANNGYLDIDAFKELLISVKVK